MSELGKLLLSMLVPPLTVDATTRWRLSISLITILLMFLFFGHVAWAMGIVPGLEGFARQNMLDEQAKKIDSILIAQDEILIRIVASSIEESRGRQCAMLNAGHGEDAEGWARNLTASLSEYQTRSGKAYQLRPCNEYGL